MKMDFQLFHSRKRARKFGKNNDEEVFVQASQLAQHRLEQCMADLQNVLPSEQPFALPSTAQLYEHPGMDLVREAITTDNASKSPR